MSLFSTTAFILRLDPLSEKDVAAALLTRDHGVVRAAVKGARGKSKRAAALQTLTEVETTLFTSEGRELARVEALEIVKSAFALTARAETAMLLPYLAESALTFVPEAEPGNEVYRLVRHVLDALEGGCDPELAARYFEVWLLRFAGLLPQDESCAACGSPLADGAAFLDPEHTGFFDDGCAPRGAVPVPANARAFLRAVRRSPLPSLARPPEAVLDALEAAAREVRRRFLGYELKSYRFLRALG